MTKAPTLALLTALLAACSSSNTPTAEPVAFAGTLMRQDDRILLMDCDLHAMTLQGALRDSVVAKWKGRGQMPSNTGLWLQVMADDSTFSSGRVTQVSSQAPCQRAIVGTFAQEADKEGRFPAKVGLQEDGNFSMAVVPPGADRVDVSGTWTRDGNKILLKGSDKEMIIEVVGPDELLLGDSAVFGAPLRLTRR